MATAVWRGQLTFGLLSFPVKLYAAARRDPISFRNLRKRPEPALEEQEVKFASPPAGVKSPPEPQVERGMDREMERRTESTSEPVYTAQDRVTHASATGPTPAPIVKGYEFEEDQFVAIDPAEIRKLAKSTSREMEVSEFVNWNEIDPVYLDASYYVVPDPSGEKPYSLLFAAMKKTEFAAVAQIAMHGREQVLVLRLGSKGLVAHTMYYFAEVRRDEEFTARMDDLKPKEVELAQKLIEHMAAPFQPEQYVDAYKARVRALVESKVERVSKRVEPVSDSVSVSRKPPVDILDALKRSLEKAAERKAPQKAASGPLRPKRKTA